MVKKTKAKSKSKSKVQRGKKKAMGLRSKRGAVKKLLASKRKKTTGKAKSKSKRQKVTYLPAGYNTITPYLIVSDGESAIAFYTKIFNAKLKLRMDHPSGKVGHAELLIGDTKIMLADEHPGMDARAPESFGGSPVGIHLYVKNVDDVIEKAVDNGAKLLRSPEDMFYGDRSGSIRDPFGHNWFIATHIEDVTPKETRKRAEKLFKQSDTMRAEKPEMAE